MPSSYTSSSEPATSPIGGASKPPQPPAAGSSKRGAARLFAFFLLLGAGAFVLQQTINYGLRRIPTSDFGISNRILSGQVNADIVISGSSRAVVQYDPTIIEQQTGLKTFNIGRNGSQTDMQLAVLKGYLKHNSKPRLVIHNLDMFSFVTSHKEVYDPAQYMPYLNEESIYNALLKINPDVWKWKYIPLYSYAVDDMRLTWTRGIAGALGLYPKQDCFNGFRPSHKHWTGDFERFKADNPDGVRFEIEPDGVRDLEELIAICRREGIPVLLVYSPVYSNMQALEKNHAEVFSKFQELSKRWQAPIWDFSGSSICARRDLFYNSQHLNADGAEAFSQQLAGRLRSEYFRNNSVALKTFHPGNK